MICRVEKVPGTFISTDSTKKSANVVQVAINWPCAKGTIPIPGAPTLQQIIQSNYATLLWNLTPTEMAVLDAVLASYSYSDPTTYHYITISQKR